MLLVHPVIRPHDKAVEGDGRLDDRTLLVVARLEGIRLLDAAMLEDSKTLLGPATLNDSRTLLEPA